MKCSSSPVYLVSVNASRRKIRRLAEHKIFSGATWLYLGRDYLAMKSWEDAIGSLIPRIQYAAQFQEIAHAWRMPYVEWIAQQGKKYEGLVWWSSRIAERNTYVYSLFHEVCYLAIARKFLKERTGPLVIVAESVALLRTIAKQKECNGRADWIQSMLPLRAAVIWLMRFCFVWMRYVIRAFHAMWDARVTRKGSFTLAPISSKKRILLHSCIDESFFGKDGSAHDRYFTVLPEELRKRGYEVVHIPWLCSIARSKKEAFLWFRAHPGQYLIPEDYYSIFDYLWAGWITISQMRLLRGRQFFQDMDVTVLVRDANRRAATDTDMPIFGRYARLIKKLKSRGFHFDIFLDKFENMLTEKPQIMALRSYMPKVKIVGFQHYLAPYPLQLNMVTTVEEAKIAPLPDIIVCNAPLAADLFEKQGFGHDRLRIGPSLRYLYFTKINHAPPQTKTVLVSLPLDHGVAAEALDKLIQAFPTDEGVMFFLKVHPMILQKRERWLFDRSLPAYMSVVRGDMGQWISKAACAIVSPGSTSALELILAGIPTITIGRDTDFDISPLQWFHDLKAPIVHTAQELHDAVLYYLSSSEACDTIRAWAERMRPKAVSAVSEETIRVFVS